MIVFYKPLRTSKTLLANLDPGIKEYVLVLRQARIETCESCQGGVGHAFLEPTIRFHGDTSEGYRAFAWAKQHALPVRELRRTWKVIDGELTGPGWEMVFHPEPTCPLH